MPAILSDREIEDYRSNGYLIPHYRLPPAIVARLQKDCASILEKNDGDAIDYIGNPHLPLTSREGKIGGGAHFFSYALLPGVLDILQQVLEEDLIFWTMSIFAKRSKVGAETPWHQDGHYWPMRPLRAATVWISVDGSSRENGCVQVIPGSHQRGLLSHIVEGAREIGFSDEIPRALYDEKLAQDLVLEPGQFSIHDVFTLHGSQPNRSGRPRTGLQLCYMPASSLYDRSIPPRVASLYKSPKSATERPIWLVRGQNRHPGNDFQIGHDDLAELDRMVGKFGEEV